MLTLYRPFNSLFRDTGLFDDWERDFFAPMFAGSGMRGMRGFSPAVDVVERDMAYVLRAEVPGVSPDDIELSVENDVLTLKGERKHETERDTGGYRRVERSYGSFARSFVLPQGTDVDEIEARAENGVLTVTIPKARATAPRRLEIKGGGLVEKAKKIFGKASDSPSA